MKTKKSKSNRSKKVKMGEEAKDLDNINMNEIIDSEHSDNERIFEKQAESESDSDDEIYGLEEEEKSDDEDETGETNSMESDIEGLQDDINLPNEKAWGKKKKSYYSTDYVDPDYATINEKDQAVAEMEEEEAKNIQKRLAEQLDDADFGLDLIQLDKNNKQEEINKNTEVLIKTDLTKLSKRERQAIVEKESPEFMPLVNDFKDRITEMKCLLAPFMKLVKAGTIPDCSGVSFIKTKYQILLNYSIHISFYLMLKAKRLPVSSHPVIKHLAQYRQLLNQLESEQGNLMEQVEGILKAVREGKPLYNTLTNTEVVLNKQTNSSKRKIAHSKDFPNKIIHSAQYENYTEKQEKIESTNMVNPMIENEGKRAITYQIAKNKGLTPHRKKEQRNPRVKHRNKYRKAKIRRKGAIREVRKEITRYDGEISGIKAGVKKSIKLK